MSPLVRQNPLVRHALNEGVPRFHQPDFPSCVLYAATPVPQAQESSVARAAAIGTFLLLTVALSAYVLYKVSAKWMKGSSQSHQPLLPMTMSARKNS